MYRKITALITLLVLLFSFAIAEEDAGNFDVEDDVDITELVQIAEEEAAKEKKDSDGAYIMTVTCTGDFTIGGDNYHKKGKKFYDELKKNDDNINFTMANVRDIFKNDTMTLVNFEGTFTETKYVPDNKKGNSFLFNISPSYVSVLTDNGIEAVSLENNHVMDHGTEGYEETKDTLRNAGVV